MNLRLPETAQNNFPTPQSEYVSNIQDRKAIFLQNCIRTKIENHTRYSSFDAREISVLIELILGHFRCQNAGVRPNETLHLTVFFRTINHSENDVGFTSTG